MYTAVIADDEVWIRKWLEQVLSNYDKEIRVAASLDDGLKVKEFLEKEEADILISDIRMPGMTGLELARWLREQGRTTKVMIISGYSDFEYAKEALHWNAVDYILKPIKRDEFTGALNKIIELLDEEEKQRYARDHFKIVVERCYRDCLMFQEDSALQKLMETLERNGLGDSPYYVALLQKEGESYETVMDIFKKYHFPEQAVYLVSWNEASWYAFILEKGGAGTRAAAMHLANDWQEERMLFAMTGRYESTGDVWKAMDCLMEKLMEQAADRVKAETAGNNMVIGKNMEQLCGRIVFYLRSLDREKVRTEIKEFYAGFREGAVEAKYLYAYHLMLAGEMMKLVIADGGVPADRLITDGAQLSVMARGYFHVSSLEEKTISYAEKLLDFLEEKKRMEGSNVVENVKEYMENNYEKELSLTYISEMFHINTSYFSKKFKEETGRNFIEYLTEIRLREAKRLLASTGLTIAQVGEHTGYREPKYFSRIFMKYTGMTPSSYREEKGINSNETKKNQVRNL